MFLGGLLNGEHKRSTMDCYYNDQDNQFSDRNLNSYGSESYIQSALAIPL